jgi:hypothetical protein
MGFSGRIGTTFAVWFSIICPGTPVNCGLSVLKRANCDWKVCARQDTPSFSKSEQTASDGKEAQASIQRSEGIDSICNCPHCGTESGRGQAKMSIGYLSDIVQMCWRRDLTTPYGQHRILPVIQASKGIMPGDPAVMDLV